MFLFPKTHNYSEEACLVALSLAPHIGMARIKLLTNYFGSATAVFEQHLPELTKVEGIGKLCAESITKFQDWATVESLLRATRKKEYGLVHATLPEYPQLLNELFDPPALLWHRGEYLPQDQNAVAIVGTRKASEYGKKVAYQFAKALAAQGITVVSGLALGIDTAAHQGALDGGGRTIAVLGSGLNHIYPAINQKLAERIVENGVLYSEFFPHTQPDAGNFPRRNRIISGLSKGVLVAEAHAKGGALLTAYLALEQNREVFAVPNRIFDAASGNNRLIQEGTAKLVNNVEDILVELAGFTALPKSTASPKPMPQLNGVEARIYEALGEEAIHLDVLCAKTNLEVSDALVYLLQLEFKGVIKQFAGKMFAIA